MTSISPERIAPIEARRSRSPAQAGVQPLNQLARQRERRGAPSWAPAFAGEQPTAIPARRIPQIAAPSPRHARGSGDPASSFFSASPRLRANQIDSRGDAESAEKSSWIPAFAGMTEVGRYS